MASNPFFRCSRLHYGCAAWVVMTALWGVSGCESNPEAIETADSITPGPDGTAPTDATESQDNILPPGDQTSGNDQAASDSEPADVPAPPFETNAHLDHPEGILAAGGHVFVTNTAFDDETFAFGDGFVTIIDPRTRAQVAEIPTSQKNPQFLARAGSYVAVVCSGETRYDVQSNTNTVVSDGAVDLIPISGVVGRSRPAVSIPIVRPAGGDERLGAPGDIAVTADGRFAYIASGTRADLFKVDLNNRTVVRGPERPIAVYSHDGNDTLSVAIGADGLLWIASFNSDRVYRLDTATDLFVQPPLDLDATAGMLEGPLDITWRDDAQHPDIFVLMSLSEAVGTVDLFTDVPTVDAATWTTGTYPNRLLWDYGVLYVVNSGDNNILRINPGAQTVDDPWVALDPNDNPWDIAVHVGDAGRTAFVSNFMSNSVTAIDVRQRTIIGRIRNP